MGVSFIGVSWSPHHAILVSSPAVAVAAQQVALRLIVWRWVYADHRDERAFVADFQSLNQHRALLHLVGFGNCVCQPDKHASEGARVECQPQARDDGGEE